MRKSLWSLSVVIFLWSACPQAVAQDQYTQGPVWRINLLRVKQSKLNDFWVERQKNWKPINAEYKKAGVVLDYKMYQKLSTDNPNDWNVMMAIEYKDLATLDTFDARTLPIRKKHYGTAEARQQAGENRAKIFDVVGTYLIREIVLKDLPPTEAGR